MSNAGRKWPTNVALVVVSVAVSLALCEFILRFRYATPGYTPRPEIAAIQSYLKLHPTLGFTWKENVKPEENVVFKVADAVFQPLSTDESGFINPPEAIAQRLGGTPVDVIDLGDSFVEHAAYEWRKQFAQRGLSYYNMAIHRQCPPQYNIILEQYALPCHPQWVVYGVFENDPAEIEDFDNWRASGMDWFTFHSGTWCGPPLSISPLERLLKKHFRGFVGLGRVLSERWRSAGAGANDIKDVNKDSRRLLDFITRANQAANGAGVRLLVVLVPSKETTLHGRSPESAIFDALIPPLSASGIRFLDLRAIFAAAPEPQSLYYAEDGHWNVNGIRLAGAAILDLFSQK